MSKIHLPKIPVLRTMHCEDHATFVIPPQNRDLFIAKLVAQGLTAMPTIVTTEFAGEHVAMVVKPGATQTCERMVGVSSSGDPNSPINKLCELGKERGARGVLQHIAYAVSPTASFRGVRRQLEDEGVKFMTPVLEYCDPNGAVLRQMFVACKVPFGPFIEIIQRSTDEKGNPFQGFNAGQIDALYRYYHEYSVGLARG